MEPWLGWALLALGVYAVWGFLPSQTRRHLDAESAVVYEAAGGVACAAAVWLVAALAGTGFRVQWHPAGAALGAATGVCLVLGGYAYLRANEPGNLVAVVSLTSLYPALTVVAGAVVLGQGASAQQWVGMGLAIVGVVLVCSKP